MFLYSQSQEQNQNNYPGKSQKEEREEEGNKTSLNAHSVTGTELGASIHINKGIAK